MAILLNVQKILPPFVVTRRSPKTRIANYLINEDNGEINIWLTISKLPFDILKTECVILASNEKINQNHKILVQSAEIKKGQQIRIFFHYYTRLEKKHISSCSSI